MRTKGSLKKEYKELFDEIENIFQQNEVLSTRQIHLKLLNKYSKLSWTTIRFYLGILEKTGKVEQLKTPTQLILWKKK